MFVLKRNQIIITALVIMVAVAGYLTWADSRVVEDSIIGYWLDEQGEIRALITQDGEVVATIFPEDYPIDEPWIVTHDPTIAVYGEDIDWVNLETLDIGEIIALPFQDTPGTPGEAIFVNRSYESSFFVQQRLNREQARSGERAVLNDLINNMNVADNQRAEAADAMLEIQRRIERETAAEALIEAKGFAEAYVRISDVSVDVIVSKDALTDAELAQIVEIIKRKTGMNETQIHVSPMRRDN